MKIGIKYIRGNLSLDLWHFTQEKVEYLKEDEWMGNASKRLIDFENKLLEAMNKHGWDGIEDEQRLQWTKMGALFYSIIVITTIGMCQLFYFSCVSHIFFVHIHMRNYLHLNVFKTNENVVRNNKAIT